MHAPTISEMQLQILGNHGKVLGAITYSVSTHSPVPSAEQSAQRTQPQPHSQAQPESDQHGILSSEDDCSESSSSSVAAMHTASVGGQSQPAAHAATDAGSDAAALQASTVLTAFGTDMHTVSKRDVSAAVAHDQLGTEAVSSSLDGDLDADSLIPSSSGMLLEKGITSALLLMQISQLVTLHCGYVLWFVQLHEHLLPL